MNIFLIYSNISARFIDEMKPTINNDVFNTYIKALEIVKDEFDQEIKRTTRDNSGNARNDESAADQY